MYQLTISFQPAGKTPMYEQLYRYFAGEIHGGNLRSGEKLPSKRSLCAHLGVSRSTVEAAYDLLVAEGYVYTRPKSGYYVSELVPFSDNPPATGETRSVPEPALPGKAVPPREPERADKPDFDFSTGSVDVSLFPYSSWARLNREIVYNSPELLQRGDRQGDAPLRDALCGFLSEYRGVRCGPEQIVVGAGIEYLMGLLLELLPGDAVFGLEDPGYSVVRHTVLSGGRRLCDLPLDKSGLSDTALEASGVTVAYITPSHQFPMGITMPVSRRSRLLRWASEREGRYIIEDDYDSEFRYASRTIPAMQGLDATGKVVYLGSFSRSLAPSLRLAYMVLPPALLDRYRGLFGHSRSTVSRYEQAVMARFLREGFYVRYLRRVGNLYRKRRGLLLAALEDIEGVRISGSGGGIHFLLTNERYSEEELLRRAGEQGILLRGLSAYCQTAPPLPSTLVLGYGGLEEAKIPEAAALLKKAWK